MKLSTLLELDNSPGKIKTPKLNSEGSISEGTNVQLLHKKTGITKHIKVPNS